MTYVSRKTRIIVSRWSDECDAEYTLRASKKRSDGRLKRHVSCDDLRAWINNNCVKHEYLVDLMSDGEFLGKPPFRLYGRFIPVPILFKLTQRTKIGNLGGEHKGSNLRNSKSDAKTGQYPGCVTKIDRSGSKCTQISSDNGSQDSQVGGKVSFTRLEWEKNLLEKRLCECTCLLNKAVGQLERIDCIVGFASYETCSTENTENVRNEQIQRAFTKSKLRCTCPPRSNNSSNLSQSRSYVKKLKESAKFVELMRKISGLKEKLKKIQDCRREISQQIRTSKIRAENRASSHQVTELYSRREQAHIKRLQKKLEKLITERGRLLFEMCQTLTCLNGIKKSSKSSIGFSRTRSRTGRNSEEFNNEKPADFSCSCGYSEYNESTDSEAVRCSDSSSGDSDSIEKCMNIDVDFRNGSEEPSGQMNCADEFFCGKSSDSERCSGDEDNVSAQIEDQKPFPRLCGCKRVSAPGPCDFQNQKNTNKYGNSFDEKDRALDGSKAERKSGVVKFVCPESPCKKRLYADDLAAYEKSLSPAQQTLILGAIKNIQNRRPTTSPTTKRERDAVDLEPRRPVGHNSHRSPNRDCIPDRQIKSETTMKEIEKTLRNYEQRLNQLGSLECKIEDLKQKSSQAERLRGNMKRLKEETSKQKEAEREKANREMNQLCSENWELKQQVQQLTARFEAQCKKFQGMRSAVLKARELECEAEELKKELSKYRDSFEHQRKCMSKWESVVAVQRTEIENLMNHIRKLTTTREIACNPYQVKKCVQRSRSYSPDMKTRAADRMKSSTRNYRMSSEEEEVPPCYCNEYPQEEDRRRSYQRSTEREYCTPSATRGMEWCN